MLYFNYAGYLFRAYLRGSFVEGIELVGRENKKYENFEKLEKKLIKMVDFNKFGEKMKKVYLELMRVPRGNVTTYKALGRKTGLHARAVARYMSLNRLPILIPCHRVVMSDLTLGGYTLGINIKKRILEHEGVKIIKNRVLKEYVIL